MTSQAGSDPPPAAIALLGRTGVGKTSLARALVGEAFEASNATHAIFEYSLGTARNSSIIDIPEDSSAETISSELAQRDLAVAIIVVDASDTELSGEVVRRSATIDAMSLDRPPTRLLVSARSDRGLAPSTGLLNDLARRYKFARWLDTSAREGTGIQELRTAVLEGVEARLLRERPESDVVRIVRTMTDALCELIAAQPDKLDSVEWRDLERVVARALQAIGFDVELTRPAKDGGKDVVAKCIAHSGQLVFYVEIKHWRGKKPSLTYVSDFIEVNATDHTSGGLFLSSSGFGSSVHGRLAEISAQNVRLGQRDKIVRLCRQFVKRATGVWQPTTPLPVLLFEETLG